MAPYQVINNYNQNYEQAKSIVMMRISVLFLCILFVTASSCKKEYGPVYDPPTGQEGHIYEQLAGNPNLSIFVSAIDKVPGLKTELSSSGLYTAMAPNNDAFARYFASQAYKSIDVIPVDELSQIVRYHILKYMLFQVNFLNPGITKTSFEIFKYETRLITSYKDKLANGRQMSIYYTPKQVQVYTPYYFSSNVLTNNDYSTIYGSDAKINTETQLNVMGASVIEKDIAAGNGAIHIIDRVLIPPRNVAQELDGNAEYETYNQLLKSRFLLYAYNQAATKAQGNNGDINGDGLVDSLWNRTYSINSYMDNENALNVTSAVSISAFIPSKAAFTNYLNSRFLTSFANIDLVPSTTLTLLFNSQFTNSLDWPSRVDKGLATSVGGDKIMISRSDINSVKMASNGLFYELNKVVEPAAFTAVTGPTFFSPDYSYFSYMLAQSGLLTLLTNDALKYTILAPNNAAYDLAGITYSTTPTPNFSRFINSVKTTMSNSDISALVGTNILVGDYSVNNLTDGFYLTVNGTYVSVKSGKIEGAVRGDQVSIINPDIKKTNGYFQGTNKVINDPPSSTYSIYSMVAASGSPSPAPYSYLKFKELCTLAGILSKDFVNITSVDASKKFTLFVPSNEALIAAQVAGVLPKTGAQGTTVLDAAGKSRLFSYLKYFFVGQQQIFTDGKSTGNFLTSKTNVAGNNLPLTVSFPSGVLTVTDNTGVQASVLLSNPNNYPQNVIAKDGVIQVIDNAFTSQY